MELTANEIKTIIENVCEENKLTNIKVDISNTLESDWDDEYIRRWPVTKAMLEIDEYSHDKSIGFIITINSNGFNLYKISDYNNDLVFSNLMHTILGHRIYLENGFMEFDRKQRKEIINNLRNDIILLHKLELLSK